MPRSRINLSPVSELAIELDRDGVDALHRQIEVSIRERIRSGALPAGIAIEHTRRHRLHEDAEHVAGQSTQRERPPRSRPR